MKACRKIAPFTAVESTAGGEIISVFRVVPVMSPALPPTWNSIAQLAAWPETFGRIFWGYAK